jgi:hypothetical protein
MKVLHIANCHIGYLFYKCDQNQETQQFLNSNCLAETVIHEQNSFANRIYPKMARLWPPI